MGALIKGRRDFTTGIPCGQANQKFTLVESLLRVDRLIAARLFANALGGHFGMLEQLDVDQAALIGRHSLCDKIPDQTDILKINRFATVPAIRTV